MLARACALEGTYADGDAGDMIFLELPGTLAAQRRIACLRTSHKVTGVYQGIEGSLVNNLNWKC
eukprot:6054878-Amphidinium_carterae.1